MESVGCRTGWGRDVRTCLWLFDDILSEYLHLTSVCPSLAGTRFTSRKYTIGSVTELYIDRKTSLSFITMNSPSRRIQEVEYVLEQKGRDEIGRRERSVPNVIRPFPTVRKLVQAGIPRERERVNHPKHDATIHNHLLLLNLLIGLSRYQVCVLVSVVMSSAFHVGPGPNMYMSVTCR